MATEIQENIERSIPRPAKPAKAKRVRRNFAAIVNDTALFCAINAQTLRGMAKRIEGNTEFVALLVAKAEAYEDIAGRIGGAK